MHTLLALLSGPALAADCAGGACPTPHDQPVPEVTMAAADPPPIDVRPAAHLRTATFALG